MSSLLQFNGAVSRRGVHLECYLTEPTERSGAYREGRLARGEWMNDPRIGDCYDDHDVDNVACPICGKAHPRLYTFIRKPCGMAGCRVGFRIFESVHYPDLSVPMWVRVLPLGAVAMTDDASSAAWHRS